MSRGSIKLPVEGVGGEVVSRKCEPSMGLVGPVYLHPQLSLVAHQKPERRSFWQRTLGNCWAFADQRRAAVQVLLVFLCYRRVL